MSWNILHANMVNFSCSLNLVKKVLQKIQHRNVKFLLSENTVEPCKVTSNPYWCHPDWFELKKKIELDRIRLYIDIHISNNALNGFRWHWIMFLCAELLISRALHFSYLINLWLPGRTASVHFFQNWDFNGLYSSGQM